MDRERFHTDLIADETCLGCGDEVLLVATGDGTASVECGCSSTTVVVAA